MAVLAQMGVERYNCKANVIAAFEDIGFTYPSGTAAELLEESWRDVLAIVRTKATLTSWVHKFRTKQSASQAPKATPPAGGRSAPTPAVRPLQLPSPVIQATPGPDQPSFRCMLIRGVGPFLLPSANTILLAAHGQLVLASPTRVRNNMRLWISVIRFDHPPKTVRLPNQERGCHGLPRLHRLQTHQGSLDLRTQDRGSGSHNPVVMRMKI